MEHQPAKNIWTEQKSPNGNKKFGHKVRCMGKNEGCCGGPHGGHKCVRMLCFMYV